MDDDGIQRLADELEVRNLVARLAQMADMWSDPESYLECFTDDAVWEFSGDPSQGLPPSRTVGHEEIAADRRVRRSEGYQGPGTDTRHVNTTLAVRINADRTAEAESYWLYVGDSSDHPTIRSAGLYQDTFRHTDSGWKLSRRQITNG